MSTDIFGKFLSSLGSMSLGYDTSNLALIIVDEEAFPALVTSYSVTRQDRVQPVQCFNDTSHIYAFGKSPIPVALQGFTMPEGDKKTLSELIKKYDTSYRAYMGTPVEIFFVKGETLKCLATDFTYTANSETPVMVNFNMNLLGLGEGDTFLPGSHS